MTRLSLGSNLLAIVCCVVSVLCQDYKHFVKDESYGSIHGWGHEVTSSGSPERTNAMGYWVDNEVILPKGSLRRFIMQVRAGLNEPYAMVLHLMMPAVDNGFTFTVIWSKNVTLQPTVSSQRVEIEIPESEQILIESGTRFGASLSKSYDPLEVWYKDLYSTYKGRFLDTSDPYELQLGDSVTFNRLPRSFYSSMCVQIETTIEGPVGPQGPIGPPGPQGDTGLTDINECSSNNGGCSDGCRNLLGSYECYCSAGYTLDTDGKKCKNIDECAIDNGGCDGLCTDFDGGYNCSCPEPGYQLRLNNHACKDIDECLSVQCSGTCINSPGTYTCIRLRLVSAQTEPDPTEQSVISSTPSTTILVWMSVLTVTLAILIVLSCRGFRKDYCKKRSDFENESYAVTDFRSSAIEIGNDVTTTLPDEAVRRTNPTYSAFGDDTNEDDLNSHPKTYSNTFHSENNNIDTISKSDELITYEVIC